MKRAGKVFLALTLVLAMLWTSTGTSNVPGVLAENVASMQSAKDNKEAVKATTEETTTETKEKSTTASKAEQETCVGYALDLNRNIECSWGIGRECCIYAICEG